MTYHERLSALSLGATDCCLAGITITSFVLHIHSRTCSSLRLRTVAPSRCTTNAFTAVAAGSRPYKGRSNLLPCEFLPYPLQKLPPSAHMAPSTKANPQSRTQPKMQRKDSRTETATINRSGRESFDDIYLNLSKKPVKCRIAESGLGWKPANGETFTLDKAECISAQWSRASRGYELKIYSRNTGVVLLDGFKQDVSGRAGYVQATSLIARAGLRDDTEMLQSVVWRRTRPERACATRLELGQGRDGTK